MTLLAPKHTMLEMGDGVDLLAALTILHLFI